MKKPKAQWWVYMVQCKDGSLYTGITLDPVRRTEEHNSEKAAKYTRARQPVVLVYQEKAKSRSAAAVREASLKKLNRRQKQALLSP